MTTRRAEEWRIVAALACVLAVTTSARAVTAEDKKTESAAKDALKKAADEVAGGKHDAAIARLQKALDACGASKCSESTKAQLSEDLDAAKEEAVAATAPHPSGDFGHTPPAMQAVRTPLPIFFEYSGRAKIATATLRYKGTGMREYKRIALSKMQGGWGGVIPCADVARGVMRYYVQGASSDGSPVAGNGSARDPYSVPIRSKISGEAPSLPGSSPPTTCGEGGGDGAVTSSGAGDGPRGIAPSEQPRKKLDVGQACDEAAQCDSGRCKAGECVDADVKREEAAGDYARIWVGVSGSIDFIALPAVDDVCKLTSQGAPANAGGYYCTHPDGADFPNRAGPAENATLAKGNAGSAPGGVVGRDVRAMVSVDYALSANFLLGARLGWVFNSYPGSAAQHDGHGFSTPIHLELRATYLFGNAPLARSGLAPYVFAGGGATQLDAATTVMVTQNGIAGQRPMQAWVVAGPLFFALGGGARYAFSPRSAFLGGVRFIGAFGGAAGMVSSFAPEIAFQYGF